MSRQQPTSQERWQQIELLYCRALDQDGGARTALLDASCAGDAALREEVESLLACAPAAAAFIEMPAIEIAADVLSDQPDADLVGRRIGACVVEAWLGSGGMGDVYRARDANLNRGVALKILPGLFALDPDRLARFRREAQLLASLNHPNIAAIYGFEESASAPGTGQSALHALVLELVEGPTLADRIARRPIPMDEALPIARQVAEGLEAAHEQGIVHRDLKPANIKLRPDGTVKVLDFGLAKAWAPASSPPETVVAAPATADPGATQIGAVLGTAAYMSPEQAKGRAADKRSDVWAFGAVLYEMLSGQRAYQRGSAAETLAAISTQDVDWTRLPASTPASVRRLLARCLDRDVTRRLRDIGEARIVLSDPASLLEARAAHDPVLASSPSSRRGAIAVLLAAASAATLAGGVAWYIKPAPARQVIRLPFMLPGGQSISLPANRHMINLSPDGTQLVYAANSRLYVKSMAEIEPRAIQGTARAGPVGSDLLA